MLVEDSHSRKCRHPKTSACHFRIKLKFRCRVMLSSKGEEKNNNIINSNIRSEI